MEFEKALADVGEWGTYQRLVLYLLLIPATLPCAFQAYNQLFMASVPDHWCKMTSKGEGTMDPRDLRNLSIPFDENTNSYSRCEEYSGSELNNDGSLSSTPCTVGWTYDLPEGTTSVVAEWDLVCSKAFHPTLALVLLGASGLVGTIVFGYIQDGLGRHPAFYIYLTLLCLFGGATAWAPSFGWWLLFRVGVGFTVPSVMTTPFVMSIELVGPKQRTYTTVVMNVGYSSGLILLSIVAYFVRDWRYLAIATSFPFLVFFLAFRLLPESPRWLAAMGRVKEAQNILLRIARVNGRKMERTFLEDAYMKGSLQGPHSSEDKNQRSYGVLDLFKTPNLARKTLIVTFIWFTNTSVYVGLSYYAPALGGDAYLNFFLAGVAELPTYLFLWVSMEYWGRRWTLCFSMVVGGLACIATVLTTNSHSSTLALYCIGKFGISSSFVVLPLMASEIYPTVVRGLGLSVSAMAGMIGPVVVPLINYLGKDMMVLPLIIMGVLLVVGGLFALLLPETLHQPLPNTLEDGENFGKNFGEFFCVCCPERNEIKLRNNEEEEVELMNRGKKIEIRERRIEE